MFYQGTLQEAIQSALQQSKLVVCFVTDDEPESIRWEAEFLTDDAIKGKLGQQAVTLRLQAGSEEAGFLEALFPIPRKPTLVMIHNGQLKEYIAPGLDKEEFLRRVQKALDSVPPATAPSQAQESAAAMTARAQPSAQNDSAEPVASVPVSVAANSNTLSAAERQAAQAQAILAERARRLEADKKAKDAKDKADRETRAQARKHSDDAAGESSKDKGKDAEQKGIKPAERKHAQEVREQKIRDKEHRQRILKRIEDDRRDRKEKDAQERQARLLLNATENDATAAPSSSSIPLTTRLTESSSSGEGKATQHCNLQVRLFDGSTIRARFPSDSKLEEDVRAWVDEERTDGNAPYTFRVVLTPLPNKAVSKTEETEETLESLGLTPSATLVLVPVSFAAAYASNPRGDILGRLLWPIVLFLGSGFQAFGRMLRALFGGAGGTGATASRAMGETTTADPEGSISLNTREDDSDVRERKKGKSKKSAEGGTNLYNGNSLSFEPRKDSEDEDED
ncbi:hypothetical protein Micbo1qcDRAFT_38585 [Microdochium bolleyi]|uniref:UBX domain-containing protein 2 n=1 Tax=Microdochium bolleyi TaxID=196109 RepID=A0A136J974_9PEZI|nr:hypothetical protein Micbo1qcDRAFT_38585 [Microdochium bolleyi]